VELLEAQQGGDPAWKAAREQVRRMIGQDEAATCEYVEASRRATAIEFILDAFNGKFDTILADVRHDNYGTTVRASEGRTGWQTGCRLKPGVLEYGNDPGGSEAIGRRDGSS